MKQTRTVQTLKEAEQLAAEWREQGYRVGVQEETQNGQPTGQYRVIGKLKNEVTKRS